MKHTLVIVGAGLAGLSAALTAVKNGWTVKLVSSLASERAQSVMAEGGINAALNTKGEEDSPEQHYTDTLTAACGLADPNAVWGMTQAASELVRSLHHLGVQFNVTDDDELDLRNFGGRKKAQERSNAFHTISSAPCCFPGTSAVAAQCRTPILANCCGLYAMPS